ncbi:MAG TPA: alpha-amylase family glycosyl hydrolase [Polyangia bacterium]|jgi:hypothetical protein|nr:alpha-amylase family glycosyl hydrolase [Polyangia bacterium]
MNPWRKNPLLYEINTWTWLAGLTARLGRPVHLGAVPDEEWDTLARLGLDAVWLMGVWERSPGGRRVALEHPDLQREYRHALPDLRLADVVGSPYAVHRYRVDEHLGGPAGLAQAREQLARRGLGLVLDFVPNHVAVDHPWITEHPERFVQGREEDLTAHPNDFFRAAGRVYAHGKDPYFPGWTDTVQLDWFEPGLRQAMAATVADIAEMCDGVRCDMAMLLLGSIFGRTWGERVRPVPPREAWSEVIETVRAGRPSFVFLAEAYWDTEWALQRLGFDWCYDKRLYDRLRDGHAGGVYAHLAGVQGDERGLVRFIENHDEPRVSALFDEPRHRMAAALTLTLPGAKLLHEGQMDGARVRLPVQLGRRPEEPANPELHRFYEALLGEVAHPVYHDGDFVLCHRWQRGGTEEHLLGWGWSLGDERRLIVVNLAPERSQGHVRVPWPELAGRTVQLSDLITGERYQRDGGEMTGPGLYVSLGGYGVHVFRVQI